MSTLKVIKNSLKSVNNTKKITQTLRLVSASKYSRAERELMEIRPFGHSPQKFFDLIEISEPTESDSLLIVALTGDRGLCGAIHSGLAKVVSKQLKDSESTSRIAKLFCIGDKNRTILSRLHSKDVVCVATGVGKKSATFIDAALISEKIQEITEEYGITRRNVYFNKFMKATYYVADSCELHDRNTIIASKKILAYDSIDETLLDAWAEFTSVALIFWMMRESAACEHSSRMVAMESATNNATEMIKRLQQSFNRTRQAVITRELIEVISGANAISNTGD